MVTSRCGREERTYGRGKMPGLGLRLGFEFGFVFVFGFGFGFGSAWLQRLQLAGHTRRGGLPLAVLACG